MSRIVSSEAERHQARRHHLRTPAAGDILGIDDSTVRALIKEGELNALNVSVHRDDRRPEYRISHEDLEAFVVARSTLSTYGPEVWQAYEAFRAALARAKQQQHGKAKASA